MSDSFLDLFVEEGVVFHDNFHTKASSMSEIELSKFTGPKNIQNPPNRKNKNRDNYCFDCDLEMDKDSLLFVCSNCGKQGGLVEEQTVADSAGYNATSSHVLTVSGDETNHPKKLISGKEDYFLTRKKSITAEIKKYIWQYDGADFPKDVIDETVDMALQVSSKKIFRSDPRKGIIAACLFETSLEKGMPRHQSDIVKIFQIDNEILSAGRKKIKKMANNGKIKINKSSHRFSGYDQSKIITGMVHSHFEKLMIPEKYKEFVFRLIRFTQLFKISENSIDNSRCSGAIFILCRRRKDIGVTADQIELKCKISKNTFQKFAKEVESVLVTRDPGCVKTKKKLRHLYKKHGVPF